MRVAIVCPYGKCTETRAAVTVAELLDDAGHSVRIFSVDYAGQGVGCRWDSQVCVGLHRFGELLDWAQACVSFDSLTCSTVSVLTSRGITAIGVIDSLESGVDSLQGDCYPITVASSPGAADVLVGHASNTPVLQPCWWVGWPANVRKTLPPLRNIVIPCYDQQGKGWLPGWFRAVLAVLLSRSDIRITIVGSRRQLRSSDRQFVRDLQKREPRISLYTPANDVELYAAYSEADLVCYGMPTGEYWWVVLAAQQAGCQVLYFDHTKAGWLRSFPLSAQARFSATADAVDNVAHYCSSLEGLLSRTTPISLSESKLRDHYNKIETSFRRVWNELLPNTDTEGLSEEAN